MSSNENFEAKSSTPVQEQPPETLESKEAGVEVESKHTPEVEKKAPTEEAIPVVVPHVKLPDTPIVPAKDAYYQRLERVLEDGLVDMYLEMPKNQRQMFRAEGERVAAHLRQVIDSAKVKTKEVLEMITDWLKMIPRVNSWFLEQEAKIKTDRVIQLAEERHKEKEGL